MNGAGGWCLHLPQPAAPPDPPSNWAAKREMNMAFLLLGWVQQRKVGGAESSTFQEDLCLNVPGEDVPLDFCLSDV